MSNGSKLQFCVFIMFLTPCTNYSVHDNLSRRYLRNFPSYYLFHFASAYFISPCFNSTEVVTFGLISMPKPFYLRDKRAVSMWLITLIKSFLSLDELVLISTCHHGGKPNFSEHFDRIKGSIREGEVVLWIYIYSKKQYMLQVLE